MASLKRQPGSPYWYACYRLPNGSRVQKSTKTAVKSTALQIAMAAEKAAKAKQSNEQVRRIFDEICVLNNATTISRHSLKGFLDSWLAKKRKEIAASTADRYDTILDSFVESVGDKGAIDLGNVSAFHVATWRDGLTSGRAGSTVNLAVKVLRSALQDAFRDGLISENPAARVRRMRAGKEGGKRKEFTIEQVRALLAATEPADEWRGMILAGVYTGQRLGDIASLTRANIVGEWEALKLRTGKTDKAMLLPIATPLRRWLSEYAPKSGPLFPNAHATSRVGTLSNRFYALMAAAGLTEARSHKAKGKASGRLMSPLTFHSFRHTTNSWLKDAGIEDSVVMDFIGHDDKKTNRGYTHLALATFQRAADALPDVTA